jgi:hypothetical protein
MELASPFWRHLYVSPTGILLRSPHFFISVSRYINPKEKYWRQFLTTYMTNNINYSLAIIYPTDKQGLEQVPVIYNHNLFLWDQS